MASSTLLPLASKFMTTYQYLSNLRFNYFMSGQSNELNEFLYKPVWCVARKLF